MVSLMLKSSMGLKMALFWVALLTAAGALADAGLSDAKRAPLRMDSM